MARIMAFYHLTFYARNVLLLVVCVLCVCVLHFVYAVIFSHFVMHCGPVHFSKPLLREHFAE